MEAESRQDVPSEVALVHRNFRDSRDHSSEWRNNAFDWYKMVSGEQWDQDDLMRLQDDLRPAVTFNRILRTINVIVGTQINNRQETQFIPREENDSAANEVLTAGAEWVRDTCDAEDEESDAFEDMCVTGMGWTETRMDYTQDPEGLVIIERVDPLEMYWDPGAQKRNLADAQYVMHVRLIPEDEFEARWPDVDLDLAAAPWEGAEDDVSKRFHVYPQDAYKQDQSKRQGPKGKRRIRVAHMQWAHRETGYRVGKNAERLTESQYKKVQKKLEADGLRAVAQQTVKWKQVFVAGGSVLSSGDSPFPDGPTFKCMTYKRSRNERTWFGIVKAMVDPQRFGNKFFSQILDILNKGSKGGVIMERDAVEDPREIEEKWARPDSVVWTNPGAISQNKIQEKPVAKLPPGMDSMMEFSMNAVHEVTGVNLELLGFANREQAGVLEDTRKRAGMTIIAPLFDAMRRYRKEQGRVLLHFIQEYLADGRLIRIVKNGQHVHIPLALDDDTIKYDVIVDEAPSSPNMKERVYGALQEMLPGLLKAGVPMPPELLDYAPIPSDLAQKWKEQISQGRQVPEEVQKQMEEMQKQLQKTAEENRKLKEKKDETFAQLQLKQQEGAAQMQLKQAETQMELDLKQSETQADAERGQLEIEIKMEQIKAEMELKRWQVEQEMELKRAQVGGDMMIKAIGSTEGEVDPARVKEAVDRTKSSLRTLFNTRPARRRIHVIRDEATGLIESADVEDILEDMETQGSA